VLGGLLVRRADVFVNVFMRGGIRRKKLTPAERQMYKRPHPTPHSRVPVQALPREILAAHQLLAEVEQRLGRLADKPALIVWGDKDPGFKQPTGCGGSAPSPTTGPTSSAGPRTTSRKTRPRRSSPRSTPVAGPGLGRIASRCGCATTAAASTPPPRSPAPCRQPLVLGRPEQPSRKVRKLSSCRLRHGWPLALLSAGLSTREWSQPASIRTFHR